MKTASSLQLNVADEKLDLIRSRVCSYQWEKIPDLDGWDAGTNKRWLKELCSYWIEEFDWRAQEEYINKFHHFEAEIDGLKTHFIFEQGSGINPKPLLLTHGWPGSFVEFLQLVEPLAHPERFGGNVEDAFTVVVPSLPGFGLTQAPKKPWGPRRMAKALNSLMTKELGYESYIAQGGDWGGAITSWLGFEHSSACKAIHINILTMRHPDGPQTAEEQSWSEQFDADQIMQNGYRTQQATKPQSLGF
ncbi:MAG: epoxide hydrolase family protein, partial [Alphaproteobacteria bacterium]